jgi:adenylate cyclase
LAVKPTAEEVWQKILNGNVPGLKQLRMFNRFLPGKKRCKNCYVPLSGLTAPLLRLIGRKAYDKNPNFCNWCMWLGQVYPGGAEIEISLLFADIRGSTRLAETMSPADFSHLLNQFYETASDVLVRTDAFIDKMVGDEVIGLYIPGYAGRRHARKALVAAQRLGQAMGYNTADGPWLPIGIGVHTGTVYVGTVHGSEGAAIDFTALGDNVNIAARLAEEAKAGHALVSDSVYAAAGLEIHGARHRQLELRGKSEKVGVYDLEL